jgi:hypothetical protein
MKKIRRGEVIGKRQGELVSEAEHFMKCGVCGGYFDMRDLGAVCDHEGPLPHPSHDLPDNAFIHPDSQFGVGS